MTAANRLTLVRVILIPLFIVFALLEGSLWKWLSVSVFALASLTDWVDGYIARKYNQVTNFGKFMDPLADKLLVLSAILIFTARDVVPVWAALLIIGREFVVTSLRMVAAAEGKVIAAALWGKIKTFSQLICILLLLLGMNFAIVPGVVDFAQLCVYVMTAVALISGVDYVISNVDTIRDGAGKSGRR